MAGNNSKNEVAAKMIGAQLQSLLRIPPITKDDSENSAAAPSSRRSDFENIPPTRRTHNAENVPPIRRSNAEGQEGRPGDHRSHVNTTDAGRNFSPRVSSSETEVVRNRFGRPFQSLERRGRGRDYHNVPPPPPPPPQRASNTSQRDVPVHGVSESPRAQHSEPPGHGHQTHPGKGRPHRQPPIDTQGVTNPRALALASTFDERERYKAFASYEQPPRFTGGGQGTESIDDSRLKARDLVDPGVRLFARKPETPRDIKDKIDFFYDNEKTCPNETATNTLKRHYIGYLYKRNPKFPRARYYCTCCNYHLDTLSATLSHILQERHFFLEKTRAIFTTITRIPSPSPEHSSYLTDLLIKTSKLHGMNITEKGQRLEIGLRLSENIKENNLDCQAAIFGSTLPGFGFRDSNVNININVGTESSTTENDQLPTSPRGPSNNAEFSGITTKLLAIIKQMPHVAEHKVREVYTPKCVSIQFEEAKSRTSCVVHFNNNSAVLVAQLFSEYDQLDSRVKPLVLCFRHWARICDLDDQDKGFLPAHCYTIMVIHFLQSRCPSVLPVLHSIPRVDKDKLFASAEETKRHWKTRNTETIGELWLGLLKYYALEFDWKTHIITISRERPTIPKDEKQWNRKLCIEDPILPKSNLSRSVTNNKICEYIIDRIKLAYQYFGIPREEKGPLYDGIVYDAAKDEITRVKLTNSKPTTSQALQRMVRQIQKVDQTPAVDLGSWEDLPSIPENEVRMVKVYWRQYEKNHVLYEDVKKLHEVLFKKQYHYEFKSENFADGTLPPMICKSCGAEGHLKSNCPDETVPPYLPVDYPTPLTLSRLNNAIVENYERDTLNSRDVEIRVRIVDEIRDMLLPVFPSIDLVLIGSTFNGFGLHSSDVDICLTLNDVVIPPGERGIRMIDVNDVLEKTVNALKQSGRIADILSIPSAKVPIVKFRHLGYKLEGDVSLYNRLSVYNTELLRAYVNLDNRVAPLGLFLKRLVKLCDVGDASKGSLSSYSYILMLIHFLQNHSVPVLPVIQELDFPNMRKNFFCDNHHIQYDTDVNFIAKTWPGFGKNKETVGQLWLAFLNYYVEKFDNEIYVITISQSAPLTRVKKCWYTDALAIEDPFDKTHNLGSGLTRRMSVHILKTLQKCRMFFHRSTDHLRNDANFLEYYMDARQVREGNPPIDRQCRLCYRIGHYARNCTYVNKPVEEDASPQENPPTHHDMEVPINGALQQRLVDKTLPHFVPKQESPVKMRVAAVPPIGYQPVQQLAFNNNPWPAEQIKRAMSPERLQNGRRETPVDNVIRRPEGLRSSKPDTSLISHSLNALLERSRKLEEAAAAAAAAAAKQEAAKPVKEVVFFGDIGSPNADGEQIQAMLQKNEGVTFTFDLATQQQVEAAAPAPPPEVESNPTVGNIIMRPAPPGFCPPSNNNMYIGGGMNDASGQSFLPEQMNARPVIPTPPVQQRPFGMMPVEMPLVNPQPILQHQQQQQQQQQQQGSQIPYGHAAPGGIPLRFPTVLPVGVGSVPHFENRPQPLLANGENVERPPAAAAPVVVGATTAPPPGFAPLPSTSTAGMSQNPEILRNFPTSPYAGLPNANAPPVSMFQMGPIGIGGMGYQQIPTPNQTPPNQLPLPNYTSATPTSISSDSVESGLNYRRIQAPVPAMGIMHQHHQQAMGHMMSNFQHHMISLNPVIPNGQQLENGNEPSESQVVYPKVSTMSGEVGYNAEHGGLPSGFIAGGSTPVSSYGLSLSQAHHGPVVSALQMQHSLQMQGGHFHHHMRPIMAIGNYHHGSAYTMHPPMHPSQAHGIENNMTQMNPDASGVSQNPVEINQVK